MDPNLSSSPSDSGGAKAAFHKPSNDAVNRKYRRRSPVDGSSSSSDGSPNHARSSSRIPSREDLAKSFDDRRRKDDRRDLDKKYSSSQYGRHSDRHSSRSTNYHRHDDYKHEKLVDEDERKYPKLSSCFGKESRDGTHSDHTSRESEQNRSRDHLHNADKYARGKTNGSWNKSRDRDRETSPIEYQKYKGRESSSDRAGSGRRQTNLNNEEVKSGERNWHRGSGNNRDDKRDYRRSVGDHKSDLSPTYEESKGYRHDSTSRRDGSGHRLKETSRIDSKEVGGQKYPNEEKKKYDARESDRHKEPYTKELADKSENRTTFTSEDQEFPSKKPKFFSLDRGKDHGKNVSKFTTAADERQPPNPPQAQVFVGKLSSDQDFLKDSDIDAAKVAAMKAAELVNRNLIGTGYMSADQKKKLLWGNKKNTTVEESTHQWETSLFSDRERQEKFNKLMSLRLHWYLWPIVGCEGRGTSGTQTRQPGWQWRHPSREAESTPAGFGEAIYCRTASKRWPYSWTGSLRIYLEICFSFVMNLSYILLYNFARNTFFRAAMWFIVGELGS